MQVPKDEFPLTVFFGDLFQREKYETLPKGTSLTSARVFQYEIGLIAYWSSGNNWGLAIPIRNQQLIKILTTVRLSSGERDIVQSPLDAS